MLNAHDFDAFRRLVEEGAESAGTSLSRFVRHPVSVKPRQIGFVPLEQVPLQLGGEGQIAVGLLSRVRGEVEGNAVLLFGRDDARRFVSLLGGDPGRCVEEFGAMERSMIAETGNIVITSFMNCVAGLSERTCVPDAPVYLVDLSEAILSLVVMENAAFSDRAALMLTEFVCGDETMKAAFFFLPNPAAVEALRKGADHD